jgi:hypothetical protein
MEIGEKNKVYFMKQEAVLPVSKAMHLRSIQDVTFPTDASFKAEGLLFTKQLLTDGEMRRTTLCLTACPHECGNCRGQVFRYKVARR